jgi:isopenicillin-N epimerase
MPTDAARARWTLDPAVTFLNHGSYGATPRAVLDYQSMLRAELEREPVQFMGRRLPEMMGEVRARVSAFVGADPAGLVFTHNATTGTATVLANLSWKAGDEVVLADMAYGAVFRALEATAARHGIKIVRALVPFPIQSPAQVVEAFSKAITKKTRLVIADHITSATALIFPVAELVALAHAKGVPILVDGAHAPGHVPLQLDALGADFYVGNFHKWVCAPKGAAMLVLGPTWRDKVHPVVISHGYGQGLHAEFDWTGTDDPTAVLSIPAALDHIDSIGFDSLRAANHALVREGRRVIAEALAVELPHPDDPELYGMMAVVPWTRGGDVKELTPALFAEHKIEVPFTAYDGRTWVRISGQAYNRPDEYQHLAQVLKTWAPPA